MFNTNSKNPPPSTIHTVEPLKHECGVAMIRLRQPLNYYQ